MKHAIIGTTIITVLMCLTTLCIATPIVVNGQCQVYYSPKGGITDAIVQYISAAKQSIRVLAYNFSSKRISGALIDAHKRGVDVQLVLDRSVPTELNSALPDVLAVGIPTYIDKMHKIAHNKVIIVDGESFETGSFNYTDNAENNNGENALICPSIEGASAYTADWEHHKSHSEVAK